MIVLLTDADRFPFSTDDTTLLHDAGLTLRTIDGHDPSTIAELGRNAIALFAYHAKLHRALLERLTSCRVIIRCGSGVDNIDLEAAREHAIEVIRVPAATTHDVADHTMALLLVCARKLMTSERAIRAGAWPTWASLAPMHRLADRTLGLVGLGAVGQEVATRAKALRMRVVAYDPHFASNQYRQYELIGDLEAFLATSDIISLHAPLTDETTSLINARSIKHIRPGAILINTARGPIIDETALIEALATGRLSAAALDVFTTEPLEIGSQLRGLRNVVLTPHSAAFSEQGLANLRRQAVQSAVLALRGKSPHRPVPA